MVPFFFVTAAQQRANAVGVCNLPAQALDRGARQTRYPESVIESKSVLEGVATAEPARQAPSRDQGPLTALGSSNERAQASVGFL